MTDNFEKETEDRQILQETVTNEKIVTHPTLGKIRLRIPTLEVQRRIDSAARARKKYLKDAKDRVEDAQAEGGFKLVPSFRSKEQLRREYAELGWWTEEREAELMELSRQHIEVLTQLEILEFQSEDDIYEGLMEARARLIELFKDSSDINSIIMRMTLPGDESFSESESKLKENAPSTEVDDLLVVVSTFQDQYKNYVELAKVYSKLTALQTEYSTLFSDSWQEQLQYFIRLAQVYYCTENADTQQPLWKSIDELEKDKDLEIVRWVFTELNSFWQGLSDETRERMAKYGFTNRRNTENTSSEDSPVPPKSSPDGESQEKSAESSSNPTDTPDQSPPPSSN